MKIRIEVQIGDKIIANEYSEQDVLLSQYSEPRASVDQAMRLVYQAMDKGIDRALAELQVKEAIPKVTSNPPHTSIG